MKSIGKIEEISKRDVLALWYNNEERFRQAGAEHHDMAESAAFEIALEGANAYIMVDDDTDEMISICAYHEYSPAQFIDKKKQHLCPETIDRIKEMGSKILYVAFIAGLGKNAAYSTMKDVMQIARNERKVVFLTPLREVRGFYEKLGFIDIQSWDQCGMDLMAWGDEI